MLLYAQLWACSLQSFKRNQQKKKYCMSSLQVVHSAYIGKVLPLLLAVNIVLVSVSYLVKAEVLI